MAVWKAATSAATTGAGVPAVLGYLTGRTLHRGQTRLYALSLVVGTLLLAWYFLAR